MKRVLSVSLVAMVAMAFLAASAWGSTLSDTKKRGFLRCGISTSFVGFAYPDKDGKWRGFDVDFCRATAAAINVGVKFTSLTGVTRFPALQNGEVDVLYRNTTWTSSRDTKLGFDFAGVNYYDGQGFMVKKKMGIKSAKELNGATICVSAGSTTEKNLGDYFRANGMKYKPVVFEKGDEVRAAYRAGRCDAYTTDASGLASGRTTMKNPKDHIILPEIISKEPLGPATRHGDNQFRDVIAWVLNVLIIAEEKGITAKNVDKVAKTSKDPETLRMLGMEGTVGQDLGLDAKWAVRAIKARGNYGEIFERNIGKKTPINLARGLNQLWTKGGILYAPPIR